MWNAYVLAITWIILGCIFLRFVWTWTRNLIRAQPHQLLVPFLLRPGEARVNGSQKDGTKGTGQREMVKTIANSVAGARESAALRPGLTKLLLQA